MFQDFRELLSTFNVQKVKYLIVGGYAVSFHAQPRATKDIDLLIKPDAENAKAVYAALAQPSQFSAFETRIPFVFSKGTSKVSTTFGVGKRGLTRQLR